jgi:hypothetical protein
MAHNSCIRTSLGSVAVLCMIAAGHAQETTASLRPATPAESVDRSKALIRREAQARIAERERMFARLKEFSPAPAAAPQIGPVILLQRLADDKPANWGNRVIAFERLRIVQVDDDEADVQAPPRPKLVIAEQTFDSFILGNFGGPNSTRAMVEDYQTRMIETILRQYRLSPDQRAKLVLAARGDVKRLFDRIEEDRKQFERLRTDIDRCVRFLREREPLASTFQRELFKAGSLFGKTLKKILEDDADTRLPK